MLRFAVLGLIEVHHGDRPVDIGGRFPRRLLAMLLAAEGRPVSADRLAAAIWGEQPPGNPAGALQVYVSRLRRALPGVSVRRVDAGYQLASTTTDTDIGTFTTRIAEARTLVAAGHPGAASDAFEAALQLWRGEPFADVPDDDELNALRAALREQFATAQEDNVAAVLAAGRHDDAVAMSEALTLAAPYRERRSCLLAHALYLSGRQADALAAIRRTRALLADDLGIAPSPQLRDIETQILRQDPALLAGGTAGADHEPGDAHRPAGPRPTTHPAGQRLSSFVGRDADLTLIDQLVTAHRLVTVVGPAGAGKTRLATEYVGASAVVRLAHVNDASLLASAVGAALGIGATTGSLRAAVARELSFRDDPLVLDNCEHLTDDIAELALDLLDRVPGLRIVATSRTPLHAEGEQVLPLAPLAVHDAVTLLTDRIRAVRPTWTPGPDDQDDLRHLAVALDGVPLALELAAARARSFGIRELTHHLDDRFTLLARIPHGTTTPHLTLHAAIAWSIDLLSKSERDLALRLWPHEGGFPLQAAPGQLDTLASLVDQSVVAADTTSSPTRYRMLETIRAYCRSIDPEPAASLATHAAWVRDLVTHAVQDLRDKDSRAALRQLHRELPNIRAGLTYDITHAPEHALRTAAQLMWFWIRGGLLDEGRRALHLALAAATEADFTDIIRAQACLAGITYVGGDAATARTMLATAAERIAADERHRTLLAEVRYYESLAQLPGGDPGIALAAATEAYRIAADTDIKWLQVSARPAQGAALIMAGSLEDGQRLLQASADQATAWEYLWTAALSELMLAQTMVTTDEGRALRLLQSSLVKFRQADDLSHVLAVMHTGALALTAAGDTAGADVLRAAVHLQRDRHGIGFAGTYIDTVVPASWYTGAAPANAPSLDEAVTVLTEAAHR